jgi:hypothetical protein
VWFNARAVRVVGGSDLENTEGKDHFHSMKTIRIGLLVALVAALIATLPAFGDEYSNRVVEQQERPEVPAADQARDEAAAPPRVEQPGIGGGQGDVEDPPPVQQPPVDQ